MPRVGSAKISSAGSRASQRAITTFCWLPPESSPIGPSNLGARTSSALAGGGSSTRSAMAPDPGRRRAPAKARSVRAALSRMDCPRASASRLRSSGSKPIPAAIPRRAERGARLRPSKRISPRVERARRRRRRGPGPTCPSPRGPATPTISPRLTSRSISDKVALPQPRSSRSTSPGGADRAGRKELGEVATDHQAHQALRRHRGRADPSRPCGHP